MPALDEQLKIRHRGALEVLLWVPVGLSPVHLRFGEHGLPAELGALQHGKEHVLALPQATLVDERGAVDLDQIRRGDEFVA